MKFSAILLLSLLGAAVLSGQVVPRQGNIVLDGKLDETAWKKANPRSDFSLLKSRNKANKRPARTEFRLLSDNQYLYVGIRCTEPNMAQIVTKAEEGSENIWGDDSVEIFLAPGGTKEKFYQFVVTAGNIRWRQYYEEAGNITPEQFGAIFDSKIFRGKNFWSAEMRIPWLAFYQTPGRDWKTKWLVNVVRTRVKTREYITWSPLVSGYREPGRFRSLTGFPKKNPAHSIAVKNITGDLQNMPAANRYTGKIQVQITSETAKKDLQLSVSGNGLAPVKKALDLRRGKNTVVLPATFSKTGKISFRIELTDRKTGTKCAARAASANIKYDPIRFEFDKPFYSQCFYPGQDHSRIAGTLHISATVPEVTLTVGSKSYKLPVRNGKAVFNVPNPNKSGKTLLTAAIRNKGKTIAQTSTEIRILKPTGKRMVWIEKPGRLVVDGKRIFGLGWYGGAGRGGFLISEAFAEKYPSPASKHPYNVDRMHFISPVHVLKGAGRIEKEYEQDIHPSPEAVKRIHARLKVAQNLNFIYYYLADEPEYHGLSPVYLEHMYNIIKKADPYHPVMIITTTPEKFINCADILNPHPYIQPMVNEKGVRNLARPVSSITDSARSFQRANRKDKLLFGTPQLFNYRHVNQYAVYPTFDETYAWIWALICCGGQGLTPFIYYDHASRPDLDLGMDYIYFSIDRLTPYLTAAVEPQAVKINNKNVEQRLIKTKDGILLILANTSPAKQNVTVASSALKGYKDLFLFRETGKQKVTGGSFAMQLKPYQVRIFSSKKLDKGLFTLNTLRKNIAAAEKARRSSPSILFERGHRIEINSSPRYVTDTSVIEDKLFDGVRDIYAWRPTHFQNMWLEFGFRKFTAKFSKMRLYGWQLTEPEFSILKYGEWIKLKPVSVKKAKYSLKMDFGQTFTTVKCRIKWKTGKRGFELYEFELIP